MAILGLVVQQPDTVAGIGLRLPERFPRASFARSAAHNNLPSLARQGLVRVAKHGAEPSLDRYEATPAGIDHFQAWLRASSAAPPALREALHAKLEFSEQDDLEGLIRAIQEEEQACVAEYGAAHARLLAARSVPAEKADWRVRVSGALRADEAMLWGMRARRLQRLREHLEDVNAESGTSEGV
jgi:DNA-binding PadR family transcriptional regulator